MLLIMNPPRAPFGVQRICSVDSTKVCVLVSASPPMEGVAIWISWEYLRAYRKG